MFKVLHFIKRKPHLTHEQFRDHFEKSHAAMALKFCGHLFTAYQRNYFDEVYTGGDSRQENSGYGPKAAGWDLISEWILPDEAALHEIYRIMQTPEGLKWWYLRAIGQIAEHHQVETCNIEGRNWGEVDFPADLESVSAMVSDWS